MSLTVTATVTRSQIIPVGSLASYHQHFGPDRRRYECWAAIEIAGVRGVGRVKRHPARGSSAPPETWTIVACLRDVPTVQAKITEIDLDFDLDRWEAGQPFVLVSGLAHEPRAGISDRAWEFVDLYLPGVVRP